MYFSEFSSRLRSYCEQVCCVPSMHPAHVVESCKRVLSQKFISTGHADAFFASHPPTHQPSHHTGASSKHSVIDDQGAPVPAAAAICIASIMPKGVRYTDLVAVIKT